MLKQRKIPQRKCVGCHEMKPKKELIRVVKSPEGLVSLDLTGKKAGRGAYVCRNAECLKKAQKTRALERALEAQIEPAVHEQLLAQMREAEEET